MKTLWIVAGAVVVAAGAAGAYVLVKSKMPDLGPAGPNRGLAPETLAVYVETTDVAATWSKMQTTDAWRDFAGSKTAAAVLGLAEVKDFLAAIDQVATKAAYPLDSTNAMKFLGRECSVGIELDEKDAAPRLLVLTKLDVDALTKDLVKDKKDLSALWDELQKRTGKCDFAVTREEYGNHVVAVAAKGASKFHAALLGDTLAVATDAGLLRRAIDCRTSHGEKSLARRATFTADVAAVPAGATALEWYDLDALDARRASLDAGLAAVGASPEIVGAVHGMLDGVKGAHSVARATSLPDGDLYKLTWTYSKSADLFDDQAKPVLRELYFGDWLAYGEVKGVGAMVKAWNASALKKNLGAGEFGKWIDGFLDDPASKAPELLGAPAKSSVAKASDLDNEDAPVPIRAAEPAKPSKPGAKKFAPPKAPAVPATTVARDKLKEYADKFSMRFMKHLLAERVEAFADGEATFGFDAPVEKARRNEQPRVAWAVRLDPEARLMALAAQGAFLASKTSGVACADVGKRKVFGADLPNGRVHWTLVGDALVVATDEDFVRQAARAGDIKPLGASPRIRDAVAVMKTGWRAFLYFDVDRGKTALKTGANSRSQRDLVETLDKQLPAEAVGTQMAFAAYVSDDFSSLEVRARIALPESKDGERLVPDGLEPREPRSWSMMPDSTIASASYPSCGVDLFWAGFKLGMRAGKVDLKQIENSFRDSMGMDLEKELLPALGHEISIAVTYHAADSAKKPTSRRGPGFELPGFVLAIEVRDPVRVKQAVDRALQLAEDAIKESDPSYHGEPFVREPIAGADAVRLVLPPDAQESLPVHPALAIHDGFLLVSTEVDVLRACIEAGGGKGKGLSSTAAFTKATAALDKKCAAFSLLDWRRACDQVEVYAPQLGGVVNGGDVKYPDFPSDGNADEWQRRVKEYEKQMNDAKAAGAEKAKKWIDACRVIDFVGSSSRMDSRVIESVMLVKFAE